MWSADEVIVCSLCLEGSFLFSCPCLFAWLIPTTYSGLVVCLLSTDDWCWLWPHPLHIRCPFCSKSPNQPHIPRAFLAALLPLFCMVGHPSVCPSGQAEAPRRRRLPFISATYSLPPSTSLQFNTKHILEAKLNYCHGGGRKACRPSWSPFPVAEPAKEEEELGEGEQVIQRCSPPWTWKLWSSWGCMRTLWYSASVCLWYSALRCYIIAHLWCLQGSQEMLCSRWLFSLINETVQWNVLIKHFFWPTCFW